jgi:hypothetical protein
LSSSLTPLHLFLSLKRPGLPIRMPCTPNLRALSGRVCMFLHFKSASQSMKLPPINNGSRMVGSNSATSISPHLRCARRVTSGGLRSFGQRGAWKCAAGCMAKPTLLAAQHEPKSIITRPHLLNTRRLAPGSEAWFRESEKRHGIGGLEAGHQVGGSSLASSVMIDARLPKR